MRYPRLNTYAGQQLWTEQFLGLDKRPRTYDGAFEDMGNMTGEPWPLLSSRKKRGLVAELEKPLGLASLGKLSWIDGPTLYYGGQATPINGLSLAEDMLPKRMVTMGAYILIFPDGVYYNTADPGDFGSINRLYETEEGQEITYTLCAMDGTDYPQGKTTVSDAAPRNPADGDYWLDTRGETHALYQWHDEWIGISSVYVKIAATGIGKGLRVQDNVALSGIAYTGQNDKLREQLEFLNADHVVQALDEDFLVVIGIIDQAYTQTSGTLRANRRIPTMDFLIECNNRLWGCRYGTEKGETVNRIYASALGDFKNWEKFMGTSQDSYYVNVGTEGPFTGAAVHRGNPCFFKENCVHRIYGEKPANFQTQITICDGVRQGAGDTLIPYNGGLYYLGINGVQYFESLPQPIGKALGEKRLTEGAAGQAGGKYYLSARDESGFWNLYVLDTERGIWHRQDDSRAMAFAELNGEMYMLLTNGALYALNGSAGEMEKEDVTWYAETAPMGYEYPEQKYLSRFLLRMKLGENADCTVLIQYDGDGVWHHKGTVRGKDKVKSYLIPILPRRCEYMKLRLEGHGEIHLYGIGRELALGSLA